MSRKHQAILDDRDVLCWSHEALEAWNFEDGFMTHNHIIIYSYLRLEGSYSPFPSLLTYISISLWDGSED